VIGVQPIIPPAGEVLQTAASERHERSRGLTSTQTARLVRVGDLIPLALGPGAAACMTAQVRTVTVCTVAGW